MTKEYLLSELRRVKDMSTALGHILADDLLIDYINDPEITEAYEDIKKWYE